MPDRRVVATVLVLGAIAALLWWQAVSPPSGSLPTPAPMAADGSGGPVVASATASEGPSGREALPTEPGAAGAPKNPRTLGLELRVRLRGLHPDAKWTAPLHLHLQGLDAVHNAWLNDDSAAVPDAEGLAVVAVPDWVAMEIDHRGRVSAHDPNYRPFEFPWYGAPEFGKELVVDVQVVARLGGRVVDTAGKPVPAARVTAFAMRDGVPLDQEVARCNTDDHGNWLLAAPPNVPLFLVATPMRSSGGRIRSFDGSHLDTGEWRDDLLPTGAHAQGKIGTVVTVRDIVLPESARLLGRVAWRDGGGIANAEIQLVPRGGLVLGLGATSAPRRYAAGYGDRSQVAIAPDGSLHPGARTTSDANGEFALPVRPGAEVSVCLAQVRDLHLLDAPTVTASAWQPVEFVLPRPIALQARYAAAAIAGATLEIANGPTLTADGDGTVAVVTSTDRRVRATHEALRSAWIDVPASAAGTTVVLELLQARVPLRLEFDGDFRVRNTIVQWRRDDGEHGAEHLMRDDRTGPFELFLEPGRYHVTAGPGGGERNGVFLLPIERDVDLTGEAATLRLPAVFGGTFTVTATDSSGLHLGGVCRVRDATGGDLSAAFEVADDGRHRRGKPGELLPDGVNHFTAILPPGDYLLELEFERHGAVPQRVTIKPREVAEVRVRLP
ncbi:MAG: hypothetical protein JNK15_20655 [Planctomycetes bacterium]|nr:hypothetical protein [Planctomycetota bacterium]